MRLRERPKELLVASGIFILLGVLGGIGGGARMILILAGNSNYPFGSTLYLSGFSLFLIVLGFGLLSQREFFRIITVLFLVVSLAYWLTKLPHSVQHLFSVFNELYHEFETIFVIIVIMQMISMSTIMTLAYVWILYTLSRPDICAVFQRGDSGK